MSTQKSKIEKNISDSVLNQIQLLHQEHRLDIVENYSVSNALKSAWLYLLKVEDKNHNKALEVCTKHSIANALLEMVILGLNVAKKQGYFIVYGKELTFQPSYFGTVNILKSVCGEVDPVSEVIRKGDVFKYHTEAITGYKILDEHIQKFENLNNEIVGVYTILNFPDKHPLTIMTKADVIAAWNQGTMKGKSPAHLNFPAEMFKKSCINRAAKIELNTSNDSSLMLETFNKIQAIEYKSVEDSEEATQNLIEEKANTIPIPEMPEPEKQGLTVEEKAEIEAKEKLEAVPF